LHQHEARKNGKEQHHSPLGLTECGESSRLRAMHEDLD